MIKNRNKQKGVSLIEVMISLVILLIAATALAKLHVTSMTSARLSSSHFSLDYLSSEMLETLRAHSSDAAAGAYNFDMTDRNALVEPTDAQMLAWNARVSQAVPSGGASVNCAAGFCDVAISWIENIDGDYKRQFFRTRTPI